MIKIRLLISVLFFLLFRGLIFSQPGYTLYIRCVDKDSSFLYEKLGLQNRFADRFQCEVYIARLQGLLQSRGYVTASIDSLRYDSAFAKIDLFIGGKYQWAAVDAGPIDAAIRDAVGWKDNLFTGRFMDFAMVQEWEEKFLRYFENHGYPFAGVYLDSVQVNNEKISAVLKADKGPLYKIDSIRVFGDVKISSSFFYQYLAIPRGSPYNRQQLQLVSKRIRELPYAEEEKPSHLSLTITGAVLNVYLKPRKSSQVNVLLGFLPNSDQLSSGKLLLTGEANINLKNALGSGETVGLNWQQLQVKSPRLNIIYRQPFVFNTPVGVDFAFDFYRKDTAYLNVNLQVGAQYRLNTNQSGKLFFQRFQTIINSINTSYILQHRRLPDVGDVSSFNIGLDYEFSNTDYRRNPRKGSEIRVITSIGSRKIRKNNEILGLKDPGNPVFDFSKLYDTIQLNTYLFRLTSAAAAYFPFGKQNTVKTALHGGYLQSGNIFRNELFQIGGYKLLRGFDEESQFLSHYLVATVEYRYLVGQHSYFYALADGGWGRDNSRESKTDYGYLGTGLGINFETKAGIFNLALAIGKRSDTEFNLRRSKIHFGFAGFF